MTDADGWMRMSDGTWLYSYASRYCNDGTYAYQKYLCSCGLIYQFTTKIYNCEKCGGSPSREALLAAVPGEEETNYQVELAEIVNKR